MTTLSRYNIFFCLISMILLTGCKQASVSDLSGQTSVSQNNFAAPVRLNKQAASPETQKFSISTTIDSATARRAIENYRINKKAQPGPFKYVAADLNSDGQSEILVFFTGKDWCANTGCTLAVLQPTRYGFEAVSTIRRVKSPVIISPKRSNGWHDLLVRTGIGEWQKAHKVMLQFSGKGYPGNAILMAPLPRFQELIGEQVFAGISQEDLQIGWN